MLNHLPEDIKYYIGLYVPNIWCYMFTNKSIYNNSNEEYLNRIRKQNIDQVNIEKLEKKFDIITELTFIKLDTGLFRSIDSYNLFRTHDHLFITLDRYKRDIHQSFEWKDCIIRLHNILIIGKISYEKIISN